MRHGRLGSALLAGLDQAWLSGLNFLLALLFIRFADKAQYGLYLLLLSPLLLWQSVQQALLLSPFVTLYPQRDAAGQRQVLRALWHAHAGLLLLAALTGLAGVWLYAQWHDQADGWLALAFALASVGTLGREAVRQYQYVRLDVAAALSADLLYGLALLAGLALLLWLGQVTAAGVLACSGLAGVLPFMLSRQRHREPALPIDDARTGALRGELLQFWRCGRWSLIGSSVTWINLSAYPYVAAYAFGVAATADIGAARQLLMPIAFSFPVWSNLLRPRIARWYADGNVERIVRLSLLSIWLGSAGFIALMILLWLVFPRLIGFLGPDYANIWPLVVAWAAFFLITLVRTVLMASLYVSEAGYRFFSRTSLAALLLFVPVMLLALELSPLWIVLGLVAVELLQTLLILQETRHCWQRWRRTSVLQSGQPARP